MLKALVGWITNRSVIKEPPAPVVLEAASGRDVSDHLQRERSEGAKLARRAAGFNIWQLNNHLKRNRVHIVRTTRALKTASPLIANSVLKPRLQNHLAIESALLRIYASRVLARAVR